MKTTTSQRIAKNEKRIAEIEAELARRAAAATDTTNPETWFESCRIDMATGRMSYPAPAGFALDHERMYRTVALFAAHCATTEQAIKQAIWQQIAAYRGARQLMTFAR